MVILFCSKINNINIFQLTFSRAYETPSEEKLRFEIFKTNFETINKHNSRYNKGEVSYTLGVNQFADLTDEEFEDKYLGYENPLLNLTNNFKSPENFSAPASVDWRTKGAVSPVRDQGHCKSWYAFSTVSYV